MTISDKTFARKLVKKIIEKGYHVAVHNGEYHEQFDKPSKKTCLSVNVNSIMKSLGSTGEDVIKVVEVEGDKESGYTVFTEGKFFLIYNNGFDMEDMEGVVADYSANELCNDIYNSII